MFTDEDGSFNLFRHALNVSRYVLHSQHGGVTWRNDAGEPPQQIGQLGRHGARFIAVKLRQRLGLKVLEHEERVVPVQLHLKKKNSSGFQSGTLTRVCEPAAETRCTLCPSFFLSEVY